MLRILPFFLVAACALMGHCAVAMICCCVAMLALPCAPSAPLLPAPLPPSAGVAAAARPQQPTLFYLARCCAAGKNWIRAPAMLYGSFVTATMLPILAELATHQGEHSKLVRCDL